MAHVYYQIKEYTSRANATIVRADTLQKQLKRVPLISKILLPADFQNPVRLDF